MGALFVWNYFLNNKSTNHGCNRKKKKLKSLNSFTLNTYILLYILCLNMLWTYQDVHKFLAFSTLLTGLHKRLISQILFLVMYWKWILGDLRVNLYILQIPLYWKKNQWKKGKWTKEQGTKLCQKEKSVFKNLKTEESQYKIAIKTDGREP